MKLQEFAKGERTRVPSLAGILIASIKPATPVDPMCKKIFRMNGMLLLSLGQAHRSNRSVYSAREITGTPLTIETKRIRMVEETPRYRKHSILCFIYFIRRETLK